jgi:hypothetical protein
MPNFKDETLMATTDSYSTRARFALGLVKGINPQYGTDCNTTQIRCIVIFVVDQAVKHAHCGFPLAWLSLESEAA